MASALVYCPMAPGPKRINDATKRCIEALEWDGPLTVAYGIDDTVENPDDRKQKFNNIVKKVNDARAMAIALDVDAMLIVEYDMLFEPDTLKRMYETPGDVVYALYVSRGKLKPNGEKEGRHRWLAFMAAEPKDFRAIPYDLVSNVDWLWERAMPSAGAGFGCTLIRKSVLREVPFRPDPKYLVAGDWTFAVDATMTGFRQTHNFAIRCGHILDDDYAIWPSIDNSDLYVIKEY